jgi:NtrC-family two-component system response regulator AlgB
MSANDEKPGERLRLNVLVVDDETNIRKTISLCLEIEGCQVRSVSNFDDAVIEIKQGVFDVAFLDLRLGTKNGLELIPFLQFHSPRAKIVIITAYASIDSAIEAIRKGATDYIPKPFTPAQIKMVIAKIREIGDMQRQIEFLQSSLTASVPEINFSTNNTAMQKIFAIAQEAAASSANILSKGKAVAARPFWPKPFTTGVPERASLF